MSLGLYTGDNDGLTHLFDGFSEYAREVISNRAIPDARDGLKPVHRRTLYVMSKNKTYELSKSMVALSAVGAIHPHNSDAIYEAAVLQTDRNGTSLTPLFHAQGHLGKVFSTDDPAAPRYTEMCLAPISRAFTDDLDGVKMVPVETEDGSLEPSFMSTRFPAALTLGAEGIGVGAASKLPSYNFHEVLDITKKYVKGEDIDDIPLVPDFPTGGYVVQNNVELKKILLTGKGRVGSRAKVHTEGRNIVVTEIPVGKKVEKMMQDVAKAEIPGVTNVYNETDRNGIRLVISCRSKARTEEVLMHLYKRGILQTTFSANILTLVDQKPVIGGVKKILYEWFKWRKKVLVAKFQRESKDVREELGYLDYFIQLISNPEWRDTYLDTLVNQTDLDARNYLRKIFLTDEGTIPDAACIWIEERRAKAFRDGGRYKSRWESLTNHLADLEDWIENPGKFILQDLEDLGKEFEGQFPRRSEITNKSYKFTTTESRAETDNSPATFILTPNNYLQKVRDVFGASDGIEITATADARLIGFDRDGTVFRVYGEDIPFTADGSPGIHLPTYLGLEDLDVIYAGLLDGKTRTLVYTDGYLSFFDTNEFYNQTRKTKLLRNYMSTHVSDRLVHVFEDGELPEVLMLAGYNGTNFTLGAINMRAVEHPGSGRRFKMLEDASGIQFWGATNLNDAAILFAFNDRFPRGANSHFGSFNEVLESDLNFSIEGSFFNGNVEQV